MTPYSEKVRDRYYLHPCSSCGKVRVANPYQEERTGLCRDCLNEQRVGVMLTDTSAFCTGCREWHPHDAFYVNRTSRRGLYYQCKRFLADRRRERKEEK